MFFQAEKYYGSNYFATFFEALNFGSKDKHKAVAKILDIHPKTLANWLSGKITPPRAAVMLLFHESHYGFEDWNIRLGNMQATYYGLAESLKGEIAKEKAHIAELQSELESVKLALATSGGGAVAANEPVFLAGVACANASVHRPLAFAF